MIKTITIQLNELTGRYAVTVIDADKTSAAHRDILTIQTALERAGLMVEGFEAANRQKPNQARAKGAT
jgi:hypothetical protein